jgi:hypothetical protein
LRPVLCATTISRQEQGNGLPTEITGLFDGCQDAVKFWRKLEAEKVCQRAVCFVAKRLHWTFCSWSPTLKKQHGDSATFAQNWHQNSAEIRPHLLKTGSTFLLRDFFVTTSTCFPGNFVSMHFFAAMVENSLVTETAAMLQFNRKARKDRKLKI